MANEMLRVAGRGTDGLAKAIKTDLQGNLGTHVSVEQTSVRLWSDLAEPIPAGASYYTPQVDWTTEKTNFIYYILNFRDVKPSDLEIVYEGTNQSGDYIATRLGSAFAGHGVKHDHVDGNGFSFTSDGLPPTGKFNRMKITNRHPTKTANLRAVTKFNTTQSFVLRDSGKAVEEVIFLDDSTRSTSNVDKAIDITKYKSVTFMVINTLDADTEITFRPFGSTAKIWDGTNFIELKTTLTNKERYFTILLNTKLPELNGVFSNLIIRTKALTTPTTGKITIYGLGVLK